VGAEQRSEGSQLRNYVGEDMSDLRKAAQTALEAWDRSRQWPFPTRPDKEFDALRAALAQPEQGVMQKEALLLALEYLQLQKLYGPAIGFGNTTIDDAIAKCKHGIE